jgi:hypothetical protein
LRKLSALKKDKRDIEEWLRSLNEKNRDELGYEEIELLEDDIMQCEHLLAKVESEIFMKEINL